MLAQFRSIVPTASIAYVMAIGIASLVVCAAWAADECIGAPNAASAKGQHWFYRIDRATHRKCWYQREHDASVLRAVGPVSPQKHQIPEALPPESAARQTAFAQDPIWPEMIPIRDRGAVATSDATWPNPSDRTGAADRQDNGVSTAKKQAGSPLHIVRTQNAHDARLSNATDGKAQSATRPAAVAFAVPATSDAIPTPQSDALTPFRMLLLFIIIIAVPGALLPLIFRFVATRQKYRRDSVTFNWAPSKFDAAEARSIVRASINQLTSQPIDPPSDPEHLLRKILRELELKVDEGDAKAQPY
jgi:hypothetical protein